ncbi:MAG: signal peptide peptidase SppA [Myxococcota bacterium]|nr:signal peptide peptidase SppA [Myxococcota bacterium]
MHTVCCIARLASIAALIALSSCGIDLFDADVPEQDAVTPRGPAAVLLEIDGALPPFPESSGLFPTMVKSQYKLEALLAKASRDLQVQELIIHIGSPAISFPRAGELADAIWRVSQHNKQVTCHIDTAGNLAYWMAARACPQIIVSPAGGVDALGLSLEAVFVKEFLDSVGIASDVLSIGKYKDAAEPMTRTGMSPTAREAAQSLLDERHRYFIDGIAARRNLDPAEVQKIIDQGPLSASQALALGLVDEVVSLGDYLDRARDLYPAGVIDTYGKPPKKPFSITEFFKLLSGSKEEQQSTTVAKIGLVPMIGPVTSGPAEDLFSQMDVVRDLSLVKTLSELARDNAVRGVVLRIDSPGGSALASDNIWQAVQALAKRKPVVASLGDVAASGGYYIAAGATKIFASATTITGSIGVIGGKIVIEKAASKLGIRAERLQKGARAHLYSPFAPFGEDGRNVVRQAMAETYNLFVERVATGRGLDKEAVLASAEGRIWSGSQAIERKLVDAEGGLFEALTHARALAGLPPTAPVEVFPKPKNLFEMLGESLSDPQVTAPQVTALQAILHKERSIQYGLALSQLLRHHRVLTFAPVLFEIR